MPIYEFECLDCKEVFEVIVRSADAASEVNCTNCESGNIKKAISSSSYRIGGGKSQPAPLSGGGCAGRSGFT